MKFFKAGISLRQKSIPEKSTTRCLCFAVSLLQCMLVEPVPVRKWTWIFGDPFREQTLYMFNHTSPLDVMICATFWDSYFFVCQILYFDKSVIWHLFRFWFLNMEILWGASRKNRLYRVLFENTFSDIWRYLSWALILEMQILFQIYESIYHEYLDFRRDTFPKVSITSILTLEIEILFQMNESIFH